MSCCFSHEFVSGGSAEPLEFCALGQRYVPAPDQGQIVATRDDVGGVISPRATWTENFYHYNGRILVLDRQNTGSNVELSFTVTIPPAGETVDGRTLSLGDTIRPRALERYNAAVITIDGVALPVNNTWNFGQTFTVTDAIQEFDVTVEYLDNGGREDFHFELYINNVRDASVGDEWYSAVGGATLVPVAVKQIIDANGETILIDGVVAVEGSPDYDWYLAQEAANNFLAAPCDVADSYRATISKSMDPLYPAIGETVTMTIPEGSVIIDDCATATLIENAVPDFGWVGGVDAKHFSEVDVLVSPDGETFRAAAYTYTDMQGNVSAPVNEAQSVPTLAALKSDLTSLQDLATAETWWDSGSYQNGGTVQLFNFQGTRVSGHWLVNPAGGYWFWVDGSYVRTNNDRSVDNTLDNTVHLLKFNADFSWDETYVQTNYQASSTGAITVGDYIYAGIGGNTGNIQVFDSSTGAYVNEITWGGTGGAKDWKKWQIGEDGNLYVFTTNGRLVRIDAGQTSGEVKPLLLMGQATDNLSWEVDASGNIYTSATRGADSVTYKWDGAAWVTNATTERLGMQKWTQDGTLISGNDAAYNTQFRSHFDDNLDAQTTRDLWWDTNTDQLIVRISSGANVTDSNGVSVNPTPNGLGLSVDPLTGTVTHTYGTHPWGYGDKPVEDVLGLTGSSFWAETTRGIRTIESDVNKNTFMDIIYEDTGNYSWTIADVNGEHVPVTSANFVLADGTVC